MKNVYFCPNCRAAMRPPKTLFNANLNIQGLITLTCDMCNKGGKGNPKGIVKIKPKKVEGSAEDIADKS